MKVRKLNTKIVCMEFHIPLTEAITAFRQLAESGPVEPEYGICMNFSTIMEKDCSGDGYGLVDALFAAAMDVERQQVAPYPIKRQKGGMWCPQADGESVRQKWCKVFADALETGTMNIPEKLYVTLKEPVE